MTVGDCQSCPRTGVVTFKALCHQCIAKDEEQHG